MTGTDDSSALGGWDDGLDADTAPSADEPGADTSPGDGGEPPSAGIDDGLGDGMGPGPAPAPARGGGAFGELARALADEAILSDAAEAAKVTDADGFRRLFEAEIRSRMDAGHRRVLEALDSGAPVDDIQRMEAVMRDLDGYDESSLADEGDEGVELRKGLIYKAALFSGMDEARAAKEVEKSMKAGTDIDDAREALSDMRSSVREAYGNMVAEGRRRRDEEQARYGESCRRLEADIMGGDGLTGRLSEPVKRRIVNNVMARSETLPDGRRVTPLQKYCMTDPRATRVLGELFTLTDGFRNLGALAEAAARKGVSRGLADMERRLQSTPTAAGGGLRYMGDDGGAEPGRYEIEV